MEHTWSQYLFSLANWCSYSEMYTTDDNDLMISPVNSDLSYSVQTQIYLLEKLSNIYLSKFVLNENINRILNNLHELAKDFSKNLHTADNLRQRIIELIINLQVFYNNKNVFNEDDLNLLKEFREQFISFVTYISGGTL
ncbi:hypothetical protein I4U23_017300 [Adineta vaga]|nr:hypothetical protein I4U23_017300 [Adineta vaga]